MYVCITKICILVVLLFTYYISGYVLTAEHPLPLHPLQVECGYPPQAHVFLLTSNTVSPFPQVDGECGVLCMSSLLG